jgi:NADH:ubiquinone reductase (H+-translocating)
MKANIPETNQKRIVIVGAGFAGLKLARKLSRNNFQVVLLDKNNYHQFQPLFYQVATAGIEPSAIAFPLRKVFQNKKNVHIRVTEVTRIVPELKRVETNIGIINYDCLVLAQGADTNFHGIESIKQHAMPMKSLSEAINLRNTILSNYEKALMVEDEQQVRSYLNIVIVGGGPTGVELAGSVAEMRNHILPKDYPELDFSKMEVILIEASPRLLNVMSEAASNAAYKYLSKLGVKMYLNCRVDFYDGTVVRSGQDLHLETKTLVWASGIRINSIPGIENAAVNKSGRLIVDEFNALNNYENIYVLGDAAYMQRDIKYPSGHPQVAQVALQQASNLAKNLKRFDRNKVLKGFRYRHLGTLATVGRNLAVVDLSFIRFQGFFAWFIWMFVHLMAILGVKNRLLIFINWMWNYITYDQSLRLILRSKKCD